jgi:peptidyl-prolyl cis-trans isomerase B (cyclophilin B)
MYYENLQKGRNVKKSILKVIVVCCLSSALAMSGCSPAQDAKVGSADNTDKVEETDETKEEESEDTKVGNTKVEIVMEDGGIIELALDGSEAPKTVDNFVKLVKEGFYDGLTFHRIIPGFMIQGGDPLGTGMGGSEENIVGEFSSNGLDNSISHKRGVISMARSQNKDSASSQFFITNADSDFLDGDYAAFGHVTAGMDVVDQISATPTGANDKPKTDVVIKTIRVVE